MPTISKENYLKIIYSFNNSENQRVTTSQIAKMLDVSNSATSEMAKKLSEQGLIKYQKYSGIDLTGKGNKIALKVLRRHRLWELFLIKVLGLSWTEVHDEAELLEHQTSDFLIDEIDKFLSYPKVDPHGSPIPRKDGLMPDLPETVPLNKCIVGKSYKIMRVSDRNSELINYVANIGITLNKRIEFMKKFSFDNSILVKIDNKQVSLSEMVSKSIYVNECV